MDRRDELRAATVLGAPWRLLRGPHPTDERPWGTNAWGASDGALRDAESGAIQAQPSGAGDAERSVCRAPDVRERAAMRRPLQLMKSGLCTPDAAPSGA